MYCMNISKEVASVNLNYLALHVHDFAACLNNSGHMH